jgi:hypothetical protein
MTFKDLVVAAGVAVAGATAGQAAVLSGSFNIDIYNYDSEGSSAKSDAILGNAAQGGYDQYKALTGVTYTGGLDFFRDNDPSTVGEFLASGGGTVTGLTAPAEDWILSSGAGGGPNPDASGGPGSFRWTTLFVITPTTPFDSGFYGEIVHDDGIGLYENGQLVTPSGKTEPTTIVTTPYTLDGGDFELVYVAANGDPSKLEVSAVPLPFAGLLMAGALGAVGVAYGGVARRRRDDG